MEWPRDIVKCHGGVRGLLLLTIRPILILGLKSSPNDLILKHGHS